MEEEIVKILSEKKMTLSSAESCTGGMIASAIINVSGASDIYKEGFITYANEAKEKYLNVSKDTIQQYGVVSEETVREMAAGCAAATGAQVTIVSSGVAGPGGGTEETPVGLVWLACCYLGNVYTKKCLFEGNRMEIRSQATQSALSLILDIIKK